MDTDALLDLAVACAHEAGSLLYERFAGAPSGVDTKSTSTDLVSDADRDSESLILRMLDENRPGDGILGEEGAGRTSTTGIEWVIDPLDGTVNYLYRIPWWCVSVAARDAEGELVGVVHNPVLGETFTAVRGEGAWLNGESITVSDRDDFSKTLVATGFAYDSGARRVQGEAAFRVLPAGRDLRRMGSAALDLCSVSCGRVDAFFESHLEEWDKAAGRLIATEAGARVTELEPPLAHLAPGLAVSAPAIHEELLAHIGGGR